MTQAESEGRMTETDPMLAASFFYLLAF